MPRLRTPHIVIAVAVLLGAAVLFKDHLLPADPAAGLLTAEVRPASIEQTVIATGTLEAYRQVSVGAQVSGQVTRLYVNFGDEVKQGDLIAEIDSLPQQKALAVAKAQLASVKAQRAAQVAALKRSELAFTRQKNLLGENATSREAYESAEAELASVRAQIDALDAQIEQSQIQVSTAELNLGYTRITAPIDGTVVGVVVREGQTVNSAQSAPTIVKLAQLDRMTVRAEISEADVIKVQKGQPVYFSILGEPGKRYEASLRMVEPAPNSINTNDGGSSAAATGGTDSAIYYMGVFDVPNPDGRLRIAMTAQVSIVLASARDVPSVPVSALGRAGRDGFYMVQVLKDGKVEQRRVRIGLEDSINAQVLEGLEPGDQVVLGDAAAGSTTTMRMRSGPSMRL